MNQIYRRHFDAAATALKEGKIDEAERRAGIALAANGRAVEPRALLAACHALKGEESRAAYLRRAAESAGHTPESFTLLCQAFLESLPANAWETLRFADVEEICLRLGLSPRRPFILPTKVVRYLKPILGSALFSCKGSETEVYCAGLEAAFLGEFQVHFKHNLLSNATAGQSVEVARKAFWIERDRSLRKSPPPRSVEQCFAELQEVLVETGVLGFMREHRA